MARIEIKRLAKAFGVTSVLHDVDLDVPRGAFAVILGPSGCGKSTLLRLIAGLEAPSSGEIAIGGRVVTGLEPRERGCAMVFQNYALYPHMSVAENIGYGLRVAGVAKAERAARVAEAAALVELADHLARKPGELSGGQRQRVAMARAIVREPAVFLFDEPLSNLDAKLRVQMRHEVRRIHERTGATSVFVTHDQVEAMTMADLLVVMNAGRIEQIGTPKEVYDRPQTAFVGGFLGAPAMNMLAARIVPGGHGIELRNGSVLALPDTLTAHAGREVTVGLRPEALRIGAAVDDGTIIARFAYTEELGSARLYHLELGETALAVLSAQEAQPRCGSPVTLAVPGRAIHLFDAATGQRIDRERCITADPSRLRQRERS